MLHHKTGARPVAASHGGGMAEERDGGCAEERGAAGWLSERSGLDGE